MLGIRLSKGIERWTNSMRPQQQIYLVQASFISLYSTRRRNREATRLVEPLRPRHTMLAHKDARTLISRKKLLHPV